MRLGHVVIGLGMIFFSLIILSDTEGELFFFGLLFGGLSFIYVGAVGRRTFTCLECKNKIRTKDKMQKAFIECPFCKTLYILRGNEMIHVKRTEEILNSTKPKVCRKCHHRMRISLTHARWRCPHCGYSTPV